MAWLQQTLPSGSRSFNARPHVYMIPTSDYFGSPDSAWDYTWLLALWTEAAKLDDIVRVAGKVNSNFRKWFHVKDLRDGPPGNELY